MDHVDARRVSFLKVSKRNAEMNLSLKGRVEMDRGRSVLQGMAVLIFGAILSTSLAAQTGSHLRDWTSTDSMAVRYVANDQVSTELWPTHGSKQEPLIESPDGKWIFFVTRRGDLGSDSNLYELNVFELKAVEEELSRAERRAVPAKVIRLSSSSSVSSAISRARWLPDSSGIMFAGMGHSGFIQLYLLTVRDWNLEQLTDLKGDVREFEYRDGGMMFVAEMPRPTSSPDPYPLQMIPLTPSGSIDTPLAHGKIESISYVAYRGSPPHAVEQSFGDSWIAPGGRVAIAEKFMVTSDAVGTFTLIDLESGNESPLAQMGFPTIAQRKLSGQPADAGHSAPGHSVASWKVLWTADGRHAILVNALPIPGGGSATNVDSGAGEANRGVLKYDVSTKKWSRIVPMMEGSGGSTRFLKTVSWGRSDSELSLEWEDAVGQVTHTGYSVTTNHGSTVASVHPGPEHTKSRRTLNVFVRQSSDEPPMVVASRGAREINLLDDDPALTGVWRAKTLAVQWRESDSIQTGGLLLPRHPKDPQRIPVAIQLTDYLPEIFLPDASNTGAFAAQSLVGQGIAVLVVDPEHGKFEGEGPRISNRIDAVISQLSEKFKLDSSRVGVTGFSRDGYRILYVMTHPGRIRLAAAVMADSETDSYMSYLQTSGEGVLSLQEYEAPAGGTFWEHKKEWLQHETTFNLDRVRTPALFTTHGFGFSPWDPAVGMMGAFRRLDKPVDWAYVPTGRHWLVRPRERLAEMELAMNWMNFWLQDIAPQDPALAARWARLREQQTRVDERMGSSGTK